jgi:hypothetical protein
MNGMFLPFKLFQQKKLNFFIIFLTALKKRKVKQSAFSGGRSNLKKKGYGSAKQNFWCSATKAGLVLLPPASLALALLKKILFL